LLNARLGQTPLIVAMATVQQARGAGRDILTGERGADTIHFDAVNTKQNQVKTVTDLEVAKILLTSQLSGMPTMRT